MPESKWPEAKNYETRMTYFYKVPDGKSLSTISTDLYGTMKKWKSIARWNQIDHPRSLKAGSTLFLYERPRVPLPFEAVPVLKVVKKPKSDKYRVRRFDTLQIISTRMYGTMHRWREIARINRLTQPYKIQLGQSLLLPAKPTLTPYEGEFLVRRMWAKQGRNPFPQRKLASRPVIKAKPVSYEKAVEIIKKREAEKDANSPEILFSKGKVAFKKKRFNQALELFRSARKERDEHVPTWLYEIRTLQQMGKKSERKELIEEFKSEHPKFAELPMLKQ